MTTTEMKVLTVRPPWAHAMFHSTAPKNVENRTWSTDYRGRIAIHVAQRVDLAGVDFVGGITDEQLADRGHVIGTVEVTHVHPANSDGCSANGCYGNPWAFWPVPGDPDLIARPRTLWHWVIEHPRLFVTPIRALGKLQLWDAGPSLSHLISIADLA